MDITSLYKLSYGVYVTSTMDQNRPTGCITNSVMQITSKPATIAVSVNHNNYTNGCIDKSGLFAVSILPEHTDPRIIGTFGFQSGKTTDKFQNIDYSMEQGVPVLKSACGYIVCKVINKLETSTHTIFLGEVIDADNFSSQPPMTYAYYHEVIKGKSPKNAPTYRPEENISSKNMKKFVCQICGYVYEGESLPLDYICPVCGQNAEQFKEIE